MPEATSFPPPKLRASGAKEGAFWNPTVCCVLIAAASLAAFGNSLGGQFVFDDVDSILHNPSIRHLWPLSGPLSPPHVSGWTVDGRPILNLSLALNYAISGTRVWSYHALNLLIHVLAGLTLFGLVGRTVEKVGTGGPPVRSLGGPLALTERTDARAARPYLFAFAVALLWTVHPLQTEAVTYVVQRSESLMGLFYLLTIYCFIRGADRGVGTGGPPVRSFGGPLALTERTDARAARPYLWFGLSCLACLFGMGTKEVMVTAPVMVFFFDRTFLAGSFREAWRRRWPYYLGLAATWALLAYEVAATGGNRSGSKGFDIGISWWAWELTQFEAIVHYLRLAIWPHPLVFSYGPIWIGAVKAAPYGLVVVGLAVGTLWALARKPVWGFLGFWFFGILAVTSIVTGNGDMISERRMYLPLAAVIVAAVWGVGKVGRVTCRGVAWRRRVLNPPFAPSTFVCLPRRVKDNAPYLMAIVAAIALGCLTWRRNADYRTEYSIWNDTVTKRPGNPYAQYMMGVIAFNQGRVAEEFTRYREALRLKPDFFQAHQSLANALFQNGFPGEAVSHFESAIALDPGEAQIHFDYGTVLYQMGQVPEAVAEFEEALRLKPDFAEAHDNLGIAWAKIGRLPDAIAEFQAALRIDPRLLRAHANLGGALASENRFSAAAAEYEEALRIDPNFGGAHFYLGNVLSQEGRFAEAISQYEATLQADPNNVDAHRNLGVALAQVGREDEAKAQLEAADRLAAHP